MSESDRTAVLADIETLYHPVRYKIWNAIESSPDGLYLSQLAEKLSLDKQLVAFHLLTLSEGGFVEGDYKVVQVPHSKGRAAKVFHTTPKVRRTLEQVASEVKTKLANLKDGE